MHRVVHVRGADDLHSRTLQCDGDLVGITTDQNHAFGLFRHRITQRREILAFAFPAGDEDHS